MKSNNFTRSNWRKLDVTNNVSACSTPGARENSPTPHQRTIFIYMFMLLIDWRKKCRWTLCKNKVWLIQRRHLPCFNLNLRSYGQLFVLVGILTESEVRCFYSISRDCTNMKLCISNNFVCTNNICGCSTPGARENSPTPLTREQYLHTTKVVFKPTLNCEDLWQS